MSSEMFCCSSCSAEFTKNICLRAHEKHVHKITKLFKCEFCNKVCSSNFSLKRHKYSKHEKRKLGPAKAAMKLYFNSERDFHDWLISEERQTKVTFVMTRKETKTAKYLKLEYKCKRRGEYVSKINGKHHLKTQKSMKMGNMCRASLIVKVFESHVEVVYNKEHSHELSSGHLPSSTVVKNVITAKNPSESLEKENLRLRSENESFKASERSLSEKKLLLLDDELCLLHKQKGEFAEEVICLRNKLDEKEKEILAKDARILELETSLNTTEPLLIKREQGIPEKDHNIQRLNDDRRELLATVEGLESVVRMLGLKTENCSDHAKCLEEKYLEMKQEYDTLHERYTELVKTHMDYMESTLLLFGPEKLESLNNNTRLLPFSEVKSENTSFISPQEVPTQILGSPPDVPSLISPNQSSDSNASIKNEIQVSLGSSEIRNSATTSSSDKSYPDVSQIFSSFSPNINEVKSLTSVTTTTAEIPFTTTISPKSPMIFRTANTANSTVVPGTYSIDRPTVLTLGGKIVGSPVGQSPPIPATPIPNQIQLIRTPNGELQVSGQNQIQLIQGPNGELQVKGLSPGQQLVGVSNGRLKMITLPATAQAQPSVQHQPQPIVQPQQAKPAVQPQPQPAVLPRLQPAVLPRLQPAVQPRLQPAVQPRLQPAVQPRLQPAVQPRLQPAVQPQPQLAMQPQPQLAMQPQPQLAMQPQPQLAMQPQPQLAMQPQPQLAMQPQPQQAMQPQPQLAMQPQPQLAMQPQPQQAMQPQPLLAIQPQPQQLALQPAISFAPATTETVVRWHYPHGFEDPNQLIKVVLEV